LWIPLKEAIVGEILGDRGETEGDVTDNSNMSCLVGWGIGREGGKVRLVEREVVAVIFLDKLPSFYQKQNSWILFLIGKIEIFCFKFAKTCHNCLWQ